MAETAGIASENVVKAAPYVVAAKLRPPHVQSGLLQRAELIGMLRAGRDSTLTLVCAPAGYGKTTLLAQWAAADAEQTGFAWVSLDPMDGDPARLWGHLVTAVRQVHARAGERSLMAFSAGERSIVETGIPLLLDELSDCPQIVLVLEDWHAVASPACDETVGMFVDRAPPASRSSSRAATTHTCRSPDSVPTAT